LGYGAVYRRAHERDQLLASMIKAGAPLCVPPDKADARCRSRCIWPCATRSVLKRRLAEGRFLARAKTRFIAGALKANPTAEVGRPATNQANCLAALG
jgi:hypothetical protein